MVKTSMIGNKKERSVVFKQLQLLILLILNIIVRTGSTISPIVLYNNAISVRGGGGSSTSSSIKQKKSSSSNKQYAYRLLAKAVDGKFEDSDQDEITKALIRLASSQQAFKGLDGAAHEAYQRTHAGDDIIDTSVSGRAQRSASRMGATAEAMLACELIELVQSPHLFHNTETTAVDETDSTSNMTTTITTLTNRKVLLNMTSSNSTIKLGNSSLGVLVLYEESYSGGVGLDHGSIDLLLQDIYAKSEGTNLPRRRLALPRGRVLILLNDELSTDLVHTLKILDEDPKRIKLSSGLVTNEVASVQSTLYKTAGKLLQVVEPYIRPYNTSAIHFIGSSLSGGVASLAATMLDGTIPMPKIAQKNNKKKKKTSKVEQQREKITTTTETVDADSSTADDTNTNTTTTSSNGNSTAHTTTSGTNGNETSANVDDEEIVVKLEPLNGLGRGRSSALTLGAPPCLSSNVVAAFCTSIMFGDDIICRTTKDSINRLSKRIYKNIHGGIVGRNLGWMTDTVSLTVSNLKSHAHGSEGEEVKLAVPGRAYLVRPRRLGNHCSIHEVGNLKKGGREALRASLLWQLNDILLSSSMWKHHQLESYIHGMDRVQLRGIDDYDDDDADDDYR